MKYPNACRPLENEEIEYDGGKLSGLAISGIVVGALLVSGLGGFGIYWLCKRRAPIDTEGALGMFSNYYDGETALRRATKDMDRLVCEGYKDVELVTRHSSELGEYFVILGHKG